MTGHFEVKILAAVDTYDDLLAQAKAVYQNALDRRWSSARKGKKSSDL